MISTIKQIWHCFYTVWKQRCQTKHGTDAHTKRAQAMLRLQPQIEALYSEHDNLEFMDRRILNRPINELLQLPTATLDAWVYKATPTNKAGLIRARTNRARQHLPIFQIFQTAQKRAMLTAAPSNKPIRAQQTSTTNQQPPINNPSDESHSATHQILLATTPSN
jgi:hypothetical protein